MNSLEKVKDLWGLLWFDILIALTCLMVIAFNWSIINNSTVKLVGGILPLLLIIFHAAWTLGLKRALGFLLLASVLGFCFEVVGLHTGTIFGRYAYSMNTPDVLGVPVLIVVYWAVFVYIGYCIATSFLYWLGRGKPSVYNRNWPTLVVLVILDGLAVMAIDLFMDPLQVRLGSWVWISKGFYFGVPLQNFVGWFAVTAVTTALFRTYEYYNPHRLSHISKTVFIIPLVLYIALVGGFIALSLVFRMPGLALVGPILMSIVAVINLYLYEHRVMLRHHQQSGIA